MKNKLSNETFEILVSESVLLNGLFGIYGISNEQPDLQIYISGGYKTIDEAIEAANSHLQNFRNEGIFFSDNYIVEYKKRVDLNFENNYLLLGKDNLVDSINVHINRWFVTLDKKTLLKALFSYGNLIFYGTILTLWIYWKNGTFTVPNFEFPIIGKELSGQVLDRQIVATYYPLSLFLLYMASFFMMLKKNMTYNKLRQQVVVLMKKYSWSFLDLSKLIAIASDKGVDPVFSSLINWIQSNNPSSVMSI